MANLMGVSKTALIAEFIEAHKLSISELRDYCNQTEKTIDVVWSIADVHQVNQGLTHRALSDDEAWQILCQAEQGYDEVHWESIRWYIERYFSKQNRRSNAKAV